LKNVNISFWGGEKIHAFVVPYIEKFLTTEPL